MIIMISQWTARERFVYINVFFQSFIGLFASGLFYGWGALAEHISEVFAPDNPTVFDNSHGVFGAVIMLTANTLPMPLVQYTVEDLNIVSDYTLQILGAILVSVGKSMYVDMSAANTTQSYQVSS